MIDMSTQSMAFPCQDKPGNPRSMALPRSEIRLAQADGGRWMWSVSFQSGAWGFGYAPLEKWGNFAATREAALTAGIAELLARLRKTTEPGQPEREVIAWLESLQHPAQGDLFQAADAMLP